LGLHLVPAGIYTDEALHVNKRIPTGTNLSEAPKKTARGRPKTFDPERTLDVAIDSYWREGPSGISLNEVCRRAGVSKPGLYREFGDDDGLMAAVLTRYGERVLAPALAMTTDDRPFGEVLDALVGFMTRDPDSGPAGCLYAKMSSSRSRLGPVSRARLDGLREEAVAAYARWIDRAKARGDVADAVSTNVAAEFMNAQFINILTQMAAGEDPAMVRAQARMAFAGLTGTAP